MAEGYFLPKEEYFGMGVTHSTSEMHHWNQAVDAGELRSKRNDPRKITVATHEQTGVGKKDRVVEALTDLNPGEISGKQ
ncbi:hypothetical protein DUI87_24580 [Hirundo rustica rustica]|uniref:Uncharacterized protein n=1 Tax=Hirundo rustica rustica TaxID=333673 RepID=A0A3M0JE05_HIRRU|nr:hypothetical protein DUI87_24580 [Hirundo rustica rustica]